MKKLSEMSLEELWGLFPIFLTKPQSCWAEWYEEEKKEIEKLAQCLVKIHHIGSTAIQGIWAKPIIDILVEVENYSEMKNLACLMEKSGYIDMSWSSVPRISLNKGYTENGFAERVFHVHLRIEGDNDELYFRDYLVEFPEAAREYEKLKLSLWKAYEFNRDAYTNAKTELVKEYTEKARILYKGRY